VGIAVILVSCGRTVLSSPIEMKAEIVGIWGKWQLKSSPWDFVTFGYMVEEQYRKLYTYI
jgi:hypothetical protein